MSRIMSGIEVVGVAADDRAGQGEGVPDGGDQLAARHRLGRFVALLLVDLVDDQVVEEPPYLLLDDPGRRPAIGPAGPVPERLACTRVTTQVLPAWLDLLADRSVAVRAGDRAAGCRDRCSLRSGSTTCLR